MQSLITHVALSSLFNLFYSNSKSICSKELQRTLTTPKESFLEQKMNKKASEKESNHIV